MPRLPISGLPHAIGAAWSHSELIFSCCVRWTHPAATIPLLYEVNNRGGLGMLAQLDDAPPKNNLTNLVDAGNGFLFRQGFTLMWSAWASDVVTRRGDNRLVLAAPVATDHGKPITGGVAYEVIVTAPTETARFAGSSALSTSQRRTSHRMRC